MILDGRRLAARMYGEWSTGLDPASYLASFGYVPPAVEAVARRVPPLVARVNRGIWIASCPCGARGLPRPGGVVFLDTPVVWCPRCENESVGGLWRPVVVPAHWREIEAILSCRPDQEVRNWEPDESVAELLAQNLEHGDPIPEAA